MNSLATKEPTIDSREVAKMVEKNHKELLRDIRGYIENMESDTERKIAPSDFFIEATYKDKSGKTNPRFDVTRKGCEFISNKLTGQKGTLFTATYINRFHEMEKGNIQSLPQDKNKRLEIQEKNALIRLKYAKIKQAEFIAKGADKLKSVLSPEMYATLHIESLEILLGKNTLPRPRLEQKLIDATGIAEKLGICSNSGKPHPSAVGAVISKLGIAEDEKVITAYERNGHQGSTIQYTYSVIDKVENWLKENNYPCIISDGSKNYSVNYAVLV